MNEWYTIFDIDGFVETTRILVYDLFGSKNSVKDPFENIKKIQDLSEEEQAELNSVLTQQESLNIVKNMAKIKIHKKTKQKAYMISEKMFADLLDHLNSRMVSNMLHNLANKGLLEIAFDEEKNDFIFWPKDDKTETD